MVASTKPRARRFCLIASLAIAATPLTARAIIFQSTGDPNYNTTAPTGTLANSGWQYQGDWGAFNGTPVAPQYFMTAKHVGGNIGQEFTYGGNVYTTTGFTNIGVSDIRLWKISGTFSTYAPMYSSTDGDEIAMSNLQPFVAIGRGTQRGDPINHNVTGEFKGWNWGTWDRVRRWGQNKVSQYFDLATVGDQKYMFFNFDSSGSGYVGANEMAVSTGDSGGGVFIKSGSVWKLAGIMSGVSGPYTYTSDPNESKVNAALLDRGGFYDWTFDGPPQNVPDTVADVPSFGILSRVSKNLTDINAAMTGSPAWNVDASGSWSTGANWWKSSVPNGAGAEAILGSVITTQRTVTIDSAKTVGTLTLDNPNGYIINGTSALTINTSSGNGAVNVNAGSHTIAAPVTLAKNTVFTVIPSLATLNMTGTLSAGGFTVTKEGAGTLQVKNVRSGGLTINGGKVIVAPNGGNAGASHVGGLALNGGGSLDLNDNDLVVDYSGASPFTTIFNAVLSGFDGGPGINSSTSLANGGSAILALWDNSFTGVTEWPPGSGISVPLQSVIGKYTYFGDANLDGQVTGDDYTVIDSNLNTTPQVGFGWISGDTNLDGIVTGDDYTTIDSNLGRGSSNPLSPAALSASAVPEPGSAMLVIAGGAAALVARRSRRVQLSGCS